MPTIQYTLLVHKHLTGEITPAESDQMNTWLKAHPENCAEFEEIKQLWDGALDLESEPTVQDANIDLRTVKLLVDQSIRSTNFRRSTWQMLALSALLFVASGVAFALTYMHQSPTPEITFSTSGNSSVQLEDSSRVVLRDQSVLSYALVKGKRRAKLTGEAMFDVASASEPFLVSAGEASVHVKGVSFISTTSIDSLPEVFISKGEVDIKWKGESNKAIEGQHVLISADSLRTMDNEERNYNSWYTHRLEFKRTPLKEILTDLQSYYNVSFKIANDHIEDCRFTGVFNGAKVDEVIATLSYSMDLNFAVDDNRNYLVAGKGCGQ